MNNPIYNKPALSLHDQAGLLIERGLVGISSADLEARLADVNYYRLRGYTYPYQDDDSRFLTGVDWAQIWSDYLFDSALRNLLFDAIARVEIAFRTQMILQFSLSYGSRWYRNPDLFRKPDHLERDQAKLTDSWNRSGEAFKKHYESNYDVSEPPPAWMIFETATFGTMSKFFENARNSLPSTKAVVAHFGLDNAATDVLKSWLQHLNVARNFCAHHGRLFSRNCVVTPRWPTPKPANWGAQWKPQQQKKVLASVCILVHLLDVCAPDFDFRAKLKELMLDVNQRRLDMMGFPANWMQEELSRS